MDFTEELKRINDEYMEARVQAQKTLILVIVSWFAVVVFAALLLFTCWSNKWQGQTLPQTYSGSSTHMGMILNHVGNGQDTKEAVTVVVT